MYYGFSTMICTPGSLSQEVGLALGAQAGSVAEFSDQLCQVPVASLKRSWNEFHAKSFSPPPTSSWY
jgi:hypothetical protein